MTAVALVTIAAGVLAFAIDAHERRRNDRRWRDDHRRLMRELDKHR